MAGLKDLGNIWNNVKEFDLRPLREEALHPLYVSLVGSDRAGIQTLAEAMRIDLERPQVRVESPLMLLTLEQAKELGSVDLIILLTAPGSEDMAVEHELARLWTDQGRNLLVVVQPAPAPESAGAAGLAITSGWQEWRHRRVVYGSPASSEFLRSTFIPAVMSLLPGRLLALGRRYPLFRSAVARELVQDTSFSNAAYALSTGLAEVVPALGIPLNVTDMIILTKSQAFLVFKLGLALGMSTRWQDYVTEFSGVLGTSFFWRQLARMLVGLVPAWGIVPKAAVAYSGTYVVGNAVLQWYLTGRHVNREQMRQLSGQAFERGREFARGMLEKLPRPKRKLSLPKLRLPRLPGRKPKQQAPQLQAQLPPVETAASTPAPLQSRAELACPQCGRTSAGDARFCQYCGTAFEQLNPE
jgi:uncharacterized protein (DUF697 family)